MCDWQQKEERPSVEVVERLCDALEYNTKTHRDLWNSIDTHLREESPNGVDIIHFGANCVSLKRRTPGTPSPTTIESFPLTKSNPN
jgi:hypothetical protein